MIVRTLHWTVPHYSIWGLPFYMFYSTRFSQFFHERPNQSLLKTLLCHLSFPVVILLSTNIELTSCIYIYCALCIQLYSLSLNHATNVLQRRAISKTIESYLEWKLPLNKYGLKPEHPFEEDYASCQMAILPENFFSEADKGKISFKRASRWWFWEGGVEFEDGTKLEADVVFLATGFDGRKKLKAILPDPFRSLMEFPSGMMPLYR